ncbi:DegT/DnrJ/EryC1/StrS aminotransferase family protein [Corallincola luteus]|uniref:DegT/DnrJ/EryC1/StrS aminotransferase family protein n=1 Tax=Corallincola luteus TaxID=1775177 RepID=A0ABY2AQI1_9GAMM|nr:DegT/DnrJ/EryC1/StrS aminotransferase family protein [Corallincola luteus]TCI05425.1 DegT/DnrJ/EryC1/StrS aminotransferase family protein [Corallincola luteus]
MLNTPFSPWPSFTEEEAEAAKTVLLSNKVNYWTGQEGRLFEKEFAEFSDSKYAVAVANGTLALDLALVALGIGDGDEVIVTSRTFLASVSCIVNAGAIPIFADVDLESQNITVESISAVLSENTKAIICVHLAGWPCDMGPIMDLANEKKLWVIEDCAQAHGAKYKGRSVGSIGHIGAWSFCQDKIMSTGGEGGMVTTNDKTLWKKMWSYKDHGKSWDAVYEHQHPPGFRWLHESFGTNWRITEMQSAIGRIQLRRMRSWTKQRTSNAENILEICRKFKALRVPEAPSEVVHAWYKCYVFVKSDQLNDGWDRNKVVREISAKGVPCMQGSCSEVYLEKAFDNKLWKPSKRLPNAKELGELSIMFLVHPTLTDTEIEKTTKVINEILTLASVK